MYEDLLKKYNYDPTKVRLNADTQPYNTTTSIEDRLKEIDAITQGATDDELYSKGDKAGDQKSMLSKYGSLMVDPVIGANKGLAKTAIETAKLGRNTLGSIGDYITNKIGLPTQPDDPRVTGVVSKAQEVLKPTNTAQKIGFGAEQIGEFLLPGAAGKISKAKELATLGSKVPEVSKVAKIGINALRDGLQAGGVTAIQGGDKSDVATAGVVAGLLTGVLGSTASKLFPTKTAENAAGQIAQGKIKDIPKFKQALSLVNTKGVKTFSDLKAKFDDLVPKIAKAVDDELSKDTGVYSLKQLAIKDKNVAGKDISTDYVTRGLKQLSELYGNIGDDLAKSNIDEAINKAQTTGLTRKDVNYLSRIYGAEFGEKAFSKTGEALTSVNAQAFENTRKGLKEVARQGLGGQEAKLLDEQLSSVFDAQKLLEKNIEAVNKLQQKIQERGLGEKIGRVAGNLINTFGGGAPKGMVEYFLGRGTGLKTLNALDLEKALQKNLSLVRKGLEAKTDNKLIEILKQLGKATVTKEAVDVEKAITE